MGTDFTGDSFGLIPECGNRIEAGIEVRQDQPFHSGFRGDPGGPFRIEVRPGVTGLTCSISAFGNEKTGRSGKNHGILRNSLCPISN